MKKVSQNPVHYKQRAYDGKWMKMEQMLDFNDPITYPSADGTLTIHIVPKKWFVVGVFDKDPRK